MDRRTFLKSTTAAAAIPAGAAAARAPEQPQPPEITTTPEHHWRLLLPQSDILRDAAIRFANSVLETSGGRIRLAWQHQDHQDSDAPSGAAAPAGAAAQRTAWTSGAYDAAFAVAPDLLAAPHLALFSGLPADLGLPPEHLAAWQTIAGGRAFLDEAAAAHGVKVVPAGHSGPAPGLWLDHDLDNLRAFALARIDAAGLASEIAATIAAPFRPGADRPAVTGGQLTRVTEYPAEPATALTVARVQGQRLWLRRGFHDHGIAVSLVIKGPAWDRLSKADQALIEALGDAATNEALAVARHHRGVVLPSLVKAGVLAARGLPDAVASAIRHTARDVVAHCFAANPDLTPALDAYFAFKGTVQGEPPGHSGTCKPLV